MFHDGSWCHCTKKKKELHKIVAGFLHQVIQLAKEQTSSKQTCDCCVQAMEDAQYVELASVYANLLLASRAASAAAHFVFEQN